MVAPSKVNSQVSDSISSVNTYSLGSSPTVAMGSLYQATAQALANAAHNATIAQHNANILAQAVTTQGVNMIYSIKF